MSSPIGRALPTRNFLTTGLLDETEMQFVSLTDPEGGPIEGKIGNHYVVDDNVRTFYNLHGKKKAFSMRTVTGSGREPVCLGSIGIQFGSEI